MITEFARATVLVDDHEEALAFYRDVLGFEVIFDDELDDGTRVLHVGLPDQSPVGLWLLEAEGNERVGDQTGGYPTLVCYTDDLDRAHERLVDDGAAISREPVETPDDVHLHFEDPYGNEIVLVELRNGPE